jgi:nucleotide-binding universal stress UspA family protein
VSDRALEVAAQFAERHRVPLVVVLAWDFLDQPGEHWDPEITAEKVQARLDDAVDAVRARHPLVEVRAEARLGWPPTVVAEAAADVGLLVVGRSAKTQGHFGDWSPDAIVRRVRCPVVWVP